MAPNMHRLPEGPVAYRIANSALAVLEVLPLRGQYRKQRIKLFCPRNLFNSSQRKEYDSWPGNPLLFWSQGERRKRPEEVTILTPYHARPCQHTDWFTWPGRPEVRVNRVTFE